MLTWRVDSRNLRSTKWTEKNGGTEAMKYAGLLVMPTGFFLCIASILLFPASVQRTVFVLSGLAVEFLGLAVAIRGHIKSSREMRP